MSVSNRDKNSLSDQIEKASTCIREGGVVAFPTETYYGLGVDPFNAKAVDKLYTLKGREPQKPIALIVSDISMLEHVTENIPDIYHALMLNFWPGPLTLIFKSRKNINQIITGGGETIGVRISSHSIPTQICQSLNLPITATSANLSGLAPARNIEELTHYFGESLDFIIDGGETVAELCSTIVSATPDKKLKLIRDGVISYKTLLDYLENH